MLNEVRAVIMNIVFCFGTCLFLSAWFSIRADEPTQVVIVIAEPEYQTSETLPKLAKRIWTPQQGFQTTILIGDPQKHTIPGLVQALAEADVVVLSVRRQALPKEQLQAVRRYLAAGKPLLAIRTSSHAFFSKGAGPKDHAEWEKFDREVLGGNYKGHYGKMERPKVTVAEGATKHPILAGVKLPYTSEGALYKNRPLPKTTEPVLLKGTIDGHPSEPVAWVHEYGKSRVFYTSLGHADDFQQPAFEKLLGNAMTWLRASPSDTLADSPRQK